MLWSAEFSNLYLAVYQIRDKAGKELHQKIEKIVFRTVEVTEQDGT